MRRHDPSAPQDRQVLRSSPVRLAERATDAIRDLLGHSLDSFQTLVELLVSERHRDLLGRRLDSGALLALRAAGSCRNAATSAASRSVRARDSTSSAHSSSRSRSEIAAARSTSNGPARKSHSRHTMRATIERIAKAARQSSITRPAKTIAGL